MPLRKRKAAVAPAKADTPANADTSTPRKRKAAVVAADANAPTPRKRKAAAASAEAAACVDPPSASTPLEADSDGTAALEKLRALLAPPGSRDAGLASSTKEKEVPAGEEFEGPDWTSRYYVVKPSDPRVPLESLSWPLHPAVDRSLRKAGFQSLLPIQAAVIPLLIRSAETSYDTCSPYCCDVCVAAPTGQGKTLAYAVPVVQTLLTRLVPRPQAVVVLPTRDLALQVFRVFEMLKSGLGSGVAQVRAQCLIGQRSFAEERRSLVENPADVLVCTPGRLTDHALGRENYLDLSSVRWFIADEADRLLTQTYHRWLDVLEKVSSIGSRSTRGPMQMRLQKLLVSATMTWNPQKLAMLKLRRPFFFFSSQTGQHATPIELRQHYLKCKQGAKPLAVLHLLGCMLRGELSSGNVGEGRAVIFCSSVDTAHRLTRLLQICCLSPLLQSAQSSSAVDNELQNEKETDEDDEDEENEGERTPKKKCASIVPEELRGSGLIAEFSSTLSQRDRSALLRRFRKSEVKCIVCSDVAARGIDIPEVEVVINYEAPSHLQTYIHRVGRTARAGRIGHTFTFVPRNDMPRFEEMLRESADCWERIRKYPLPKEARDTNQGWYVDALRMLARSYKMEKKAKISPGQPLQIGDLCDTVAQANAVASADDVIAEPTLTVEAKSAENAPIATRDDSVRERAEQSLFSFLTAVRAGASSV